MQLILLMFLLVMIAVVAAGVLRRRREHRRPNAPGPYATNGGRHGGRTFRTCQPTSAVPAALPTPRRPRDRLRSAPPDGDAPKVIAEGRGDYRFVGA